MFIYKYLYVDKMDMAKQKLTSGALLSPNLDVVFAKYLSLRYV